MLLLGFGVFQMDDLNQCEESVLHALKTGYRLIDTAVAYENEEAVGNAIKRSGINREEIFITSKAWISYDGYKKTLQSFEQTLKKLQTDYLDLYLIHMPLGDYHGTWRAMEELYKAGKIKAIGVCNFLEDRLVDLILSHEIVPAVNQVEMHPFNQQQELRKVMGKYDIKTMAWGPFAEGKNGIFTNEVLVKIGKKYEKSAAQVIIRWFREKGVITIPKSVHLERIEENFQVNDFTLTNEDMEEIGNLDLKHSLILDITSLDEIYRMHGEWH
ncbi:MAG: aldo/keto reductase [Tetragenococcus koreensis]|nr:aldo/keto reductase [Tetragenococcus koreensis]